MDEHHDLVFRSPQRLSLVAQTVDILREHVLTRAGGERLASERNLCEELGVSRMTLRAALSRLMAEGLIRGTRGRRRTIAHSRKNRKHSAKKRNVVILSPMPLQAVDARILFWIDELREELAKRDYKLEFIYERTCYAKNPKRNLEELARRLQPAVWLLYLSTRSIQEWFDAHGLPAVIPGSRYSGIALPSVDVDHRATCHHAVGRFLVRGHRCLALLNPKSVAAGDIEGELGFRQAGATAGPGVEVIVSQHDGTVRGVCGALDRLLRRAQRPTAFLVPHPTHALTALGYLIQRGRRFPKDTALIARDHDSFLEYVVPSIARYQVDPIVFAHKLSHVVMEIASGGDVRSRDHRIIPKLIPGQTLG